MKSSSTKTISALIVLLTFCSVWQYVTLLPYNQYLVCFIQLITAFLVFVNRKHYGIKEDSFVVLKLYLIWTLVCVLRGVFIADNYLEYKQLLIGTICSIVPLMMFFFVSPYRAGYSYRVWYKASFVLILLLVWFVGFSQYYLSPYLLLFCFFPLLKNRNLRLLVVLLALVYIFYDTLNRSHIIKSGIALLIAFYIKFGKPKDKIIKIGHVLGYLSTILLFAFILSDATGLVLGNMDYQDASNNNAGRDVRHKDTRSLILADVYQSSINNDYWLFGHTQARGYEILISSDLFMNQYEDQSVFNKNERFKNEMVLTNVFTWEGLIGLILFSLIYFRSSYLAVYKSRNKYISLLGCYIAFRWSFGWVEDVNNFNIMDISLWMMIAMCYSKQFREMNDREFVEWFNSLIGKRKAYENSGLVNRT